MNLKPKKTLNGILASFDKVRNELNALITSNGDTITQKENQAYDLNKEASELAAENVRATAVLQNLDRLVGAA